MSSGTSVNMAAAGATARAAAEIVQDQAGPTMGMSPRQVELDHLWRYYRCACYDGRKVDWNGQERLGKIEHEVVATSGFMPAGFYDAGQTLPLKFRRPTTPYYLARVVVGRFTSLLFSARRHPKIVADDPVTEDWVNAVAEESRLWSCMIQARTYGGAMGSCALGFKIVRGKVVIEVHDPRWCTVTFTDRIEKEVDTFEKRYQYREEERNKDTGEWEEVWYWYRRTIDAVADTVWPKVKAEPNLEPRWERERSVRVAHNYGFCPIVWLQNTPVEDDVDGDADCHGIFDMIEGIDALYAQAHRGTIANSDPTLVVKSDLDWEGGIRKGSSSALFVEKGGSAEYLELNGAGPKAAIDLAEKLEEKALTVARCYLDTNTGGPSRTEEEITKNYSNMIEQADVLREQYGERGVKRLLTMILQAARKLGAARIERNAAGQSVIVREVIKLRPRTETDDNGNTVRIERKLGSADAVELTWPDYFTPNNASVLSAVQAAGQALTSRLIDQEHATRYVANYFQVEDLRAMQLKIEQEKAEATEQFMATALTEE